MQVAQRIREEANEIQRCFAKLRLSFAPLRIHRQIIQS